MGRVLSLVPLCFLVALASACRCSWFAPGLGHGVEGIEKPSPRTQAQAIASLAYVSAEYHSGTAPVLAVRGGRVYVFTLDAPYQDQVEGLRATFTSEAGKKETVQNAALEAKVPDERGRQMAVLSFPAPSFGVRPVVIAPATPAPAANAVRAVSLDAHDPPAVEPADAKNEVSSDARSFKVKGKSSRGGRPVMLFDAKTWYLVGVGRNWDEIDATGAGALVRQLSGKIRSAKLALAGAGDQCEVTAEVEVDDPLGSILEAGLVLGEPGVAAAIPMPRGPGKDGALGTGAEVVPIAKRTAARAAIGANRRFRLAARVSDCAEPRFAQVFLIGRWDRWLSVPYRLGGEGAATATVVADAAAWRIDDLGAGEPLVWAGTARPAPPEAGAEGECRLPLEKLEPDQVYLAARRGSFDATCSDGVLVFPVDAEERARCAQNGPYLGFGADGFPVYRVPGEREWETVAWRRAMPDRNAPDADGNCKLAAPSDDDDVLAAGPCPRASSSERAQGPFFGPDGELVFYCGSEYRRRDGTVLDLRGGSLLRLGDGGHALVKLPWGMLGVMGPDGKGVEVGGVPLEARFDYYIPITAAVEDGFLVALEIASSGSSKTTPELFHVSFGGVATSRGRFGQVEEVGLGAASGRRYLGVDGALYTWVDNTWGNIVRWKVEGEKEVLYDPRSRPAEDRLDVQGLLLGWRSAAPRLERSPWPTTPGATPAALALPAYAPAEARSLPCKATLDELDPDRVWLRIGGKLFDPADPDRYAWAPQDTPLRISGAGRVLVLSKAQGSDRRETAQVEPLPGAASLRPSTQQGPPGCVRFAGAPPVPAVTGGVCASGQPLDAFGGGTPWAAVPGASGAVIQCQPPQNTGATTAGGVELPSRYRLAHAGFEGRLLATTEGWPPRFAAGAIGAPAGEWLLALGNGRLVPVTGVAGKVLAVRATPTGFALVVDPAPAAPGAGGTVRAVQPARAAPDAAPVLRPSLQLLVLGDDGRARRSGSYAPLGADAQVEGAALTKDSALHVLLGGAAYNGTPRRLLKLSLDSREPELEWSGPAGSPSEAQVVTGP